MFDNVQFAAICIAAMKWGRIEQMGHCLPFKTNNKMQGSILQNKLILKLSFYTFLFMMFSAGLSLCFHNAAFAEAESECKLAGDESSSYPDKISAWGGGTIPVVDDATLSDKEIKDSATIVAIFTALENIVSLLSNESNYFLTKIFFHTETISENPSELKASSNFTLPNGITIHSETLLKSDQLETYSLNAGIPAQILPSKKYMEIKIEMFELKSPSVKSIPIDSIKAIIKNLGFAIEEKVEVYKDGSSMKQVSLSIGRIKLIKNYEIAVKNSMNSDPMLSGMLSGLYGTQGDWHYEKKSYDEATKCYTKAIELDPKNALAYYNRGDTYCEKGLKELCISDWRKAADLGMDMAKKALMEQLNNEY